MNQPQNFLSHIAKNIGLMAFLVVLLAIIAFLLAKKFGGESRPKRKLIFTLVGGIGLLLTASYIASQI